MIMENKKRLTQLLLISLSILSSLLFYQEGVGVNVLLLCTLLTVVLALQGNSRDSSWWYSGILACIAGLSVLYQHSSLAVIAFAVFTAHWIGKTYLQKSSFFIQTMNALYSVAVTPFVLLFAKMTEQAPQTAKANFSQKLSILRVSAIAVPIIGGIFFISLYASANAAFADLFDFISFEYISFLLGCLFFCSGAIYFQQLHYVQKQYELQGEQVLRKRRDFNDTHPLALKFELKTGVNLLLTLNVILFFFMIGDASSLIHTENLQGGSSHSDQVHQGVYTLIFSIIVAISIILYFFRGNLNFYKKNQLFRQLSYLWVFQNLVLIGLIVYKNGMYVEAFGLTYKRIGVFVHLFLSASGLITTYWKVRQQRNSWYLVNKNFAIAASLLLVSAFMPWDLWITQYNLNLKAETDYKYLIKLSEANLPILLPLLEKGVLEEKEENLLNWKIEGFEQRKQKEGWLSWNYQDQQIHEALKQAE